MKDAQKINDLVCSDRFALACKYMDAKTTKLVENYLYLNSHQMLHDLCEAVLKEKSTIEDMLSQKNTTQLRYIARRVKFKYYTSLQKHQLIEELVKIFKEKPHVFPPQKIIGTVPHSIR